MNLKSWIRDIPDFPKKGILFRDITPLLKNPAALKKSISLLTERASGWTPDVVAGIESRGFLFGTGVALGLAAGFVPVRKPGKLPYDTLRVEYDLEYGTDALEMHADAVKPGEKVVLVDDLLATGGTMEAACKLVEKLGAVVAGCLFVVELTGLKGRERLAGREVESLVQY
ncbi:MAG TPA: adenine phosphoribosyltransferase [Planctomycetes bacterium]|nr:adenine phosphoribosyltransferase [Planctomycetota bacterium]